MKHLKFLRQSKGLTQQHMADLLDISRGAYTNIENGKRQPAYDTVCKLADFFDVSVDYLLGREEEEQKKPIPEDELDMPLANKIKKLRLENDMTQEELAAKLNTTKQTIGKYETGIVTNLPLNRIKELAEVFHTTPAYLLGWEEKGVDDRVADLAALTKDFTQEELESLSSYAEFLKSKREHP